LALTRLYIFSPHYIHGVTTHQTAGERGVGGGIEYILLTVPGGLNGL